MSSITDTMSSITDTTEKWVVLPDGRHVLQIITLTPEEKKRRRVERERVQREQSVIIPQILNGTATGVWKQDHIQTAEREQRECLDEMKGLHKTPEDFEKDYDQEDYVTKLEKECKECGLILTWAFVPWRAGGNPKMISSYCRVGGWAGPIAIASAPDIAKVRKAAAYKAWKKIVWHNVYSRKNEISWRNLSSPGNGAGEKETDEPPSTDTQGGGSGMP